MKILFFCPRWGSENVSWNIFLSKIKEAGYDGVESGLPLPGKEKEDIIAQFSKNELLFIGQHWETIAADFDEHCRQYEERLRSLTTAKPLFINSQTGKDYYTFEQNQQLIQLAKNVSEETGIKVLHETHRGKFSFAAHITKTYLERLAHLRLTLDISHWFNTAETFLHDQQDAVEIAISRTDHIHSRVGFTEGPQITDPRAPEWQDTVQVHLDCWDKIIDLQKRKGNHTFTITSEFGAPPYMPLLPYTRQPIVDQFEVNIYMMNLLRERYKDY